MPERLCLRSAGAHAASVFALNAGAVSFGQIVKASGRGDWVGLGGPDRLSRLVGWIACWKVRVDV